MWSSSRGAFRTDSPRRLTATGSAPSSSLPVRTPGAAPRCSNRLRVACGRPSTQPRRQPSRQLRRRPPTLAGGWRGRRGGTVTVRGRAADGAPFESTVLAATGGTPASAANWARAHLRDLEDRYACLAGHDTAELGSLEHQITEVSLRH